MNKFSKKHSNKTLIKDISLKDGLTKRVDLNKEKVLFIPLSISLKYLVVSFFVLSFILSAVSAPTNDSGSLFAASSKEQERAELEARLAELEKEISVYEKQAENYRTQGTALESEIKALNAKIAKINLQIRSITLNLQTLNNEIESTKTEIVRTEEDILNKKDVLAKLIQDLYKNENKGVIEMIIENPKLSDFFLDINNIMVLQDNLRVVLERMIILREDLMTQKEELALEYEDTERLKEYQSRQKQSIKEIEKDKNILLSNTKEAEQKARELLEEKKQTAAEIRSRIFELIGGGELSFGEAYHLSKIASDATGVSPALILAVLDRESALGKNVGQCEYDKNPYYPSRASNPTTMHPTRDIPAFLEILEELKSSDVAIPNPPLVSCPIPRDGAYGGAMGPAQFIPSTWAMYENRIAKISGHNPPSPWNNMDAFIGTALYLSDAYNSSSCVDYVNSYPQYDSETLQMRCAAAKYYAGSRWWNYRWLYGEPIVERAKQFEEDIRILNG